MPDRKRRYRVVVDGPAPADLGRRCATTWGELIDVAERLRALQRHASEHGGAGIQDDTGQEAGQKREQMQTVG